MGTKTANEDAVSIIERAASLEERSNEKFFKRSNTQDIPYQRKIQNNWITLISKSVNNHKIIFKIRKIGQKERNKQTQLVSIKDGIYLPDWASRYLQTLKKHCPPKQSINEIIADEKLFLENITKKIKLPKISTPAITDLLSSLRSELEFIFRSSGTNIKSNWIEIFKSYPVLCRIVFRRILSWECFVKEWTTHLGNDFSALCATYSSSKQLGTIVRIQCNLGDTHQNCRSVLLLHFSSGKKILYKPKDLLVDKVFFDIISYINSCKIGLKLHWRHVLPRKGYGWDEFFPHDKLAHSGAFSYAEKLGTLIKLIEVTGGRDFHAENIGCIDTEPIVYDLECLLHPIQRRKYDSITSQVARSILRSTPLFSGILNARIYKNGRWQLRSPLTSLLRNKSLLFKSNFARALLKGYKIIERELASDKHLQQLITSRFQNVVVRFVATPTYIYKQLILKSLAAHLLTDGRMRGVFLESLWRKLPEYPDLQPMITSEIAAVDALDIPKFLATSNSTDLKIPGNGSIKKALDSTPIADLKQRMKLYKETPHLLQINSAIILSAAIQDHSMFE